MDKKLYELTNPQRSIWLTEQYYKGSSINTLCGTVLIGAKINFDILKESINIFIKNNDALRLHIVLNSDDVPEQYVTDFQPLNFDVTYLKDKNELNALEQEMVSKPFDIIDNDLYDLKLFSFPDKTGGFIVKAHHLICDACTAGLIASKIMGIYSSLLNNSAEIFPESSYVEYIESEQEYLHSDKFKNDKEFWNSKFNTVEEFGIIPTLKSAQNSDCRAKRATFIVDESLTDKINNYCKLNKLSIFNFLMAVYSTYIGGVSNLNKFILGTPILNRTTFAEKNTPGMFISTVPLTFDMSETEFFVDFAKNISMDLLSIFRHQKYPYQNILECIREKNPTQPNLYDILISYQNTRTTAKHSDIPFEVRWTFNNNVADSMQIHIYDMNDDNILNISYDYRLNKYSEQDIIDTHNRILSIINQVLNSENIALKDIELVTSEEKKIILNDFNNTALSYNKNKTVVDYFEEQVKKTPNNIALVCNDKALTYKELNEKANMLAHFLKENNVKPKDIVGIMVNRSQEMIIGLLAILKAGAAYLPLDPEYPEERISYVLEDSNCSTVLVHHATENLINNNYKKIDISLDMPIFSSNKTENLAIKILPDYLIYLIYTSGSTGNPKGVMLTHQNINNFILAEKQHIKFSPEKTMVSVTTICFDIFALEIWCSLTSGMKVVLADDKEQMSPTLLKSLCKKYNVNMIQTTPSRYSILLSNMEDLNFLNSFSDIMVGGESLPKTLLESFQQYTKANIFNMYGPTETTVWSTIKDLTNTSFITIGKPLANTTCYILDKNQKLLPPYIAGELYIGGDGVSNGYLNREELTAEKFIKSPFNKNEIIYNTNDLAYFTESGEIVHLGRTDFQVKIRGYRIELEEIEDKIMKFPNIKNCVVNAVDNATKLCAYYTSRKEINLGDLRDYLSDLLPNYMIPNYFVKVDAFPYTPNGKINKKALPLPEVSSSRELVTARNKIDKFLISELQKTLNLEEISITDSFFDIGGDSLTAINLCTKISNKYKVDFSVRDIFENPIIKDVSDIISSMTKIGGTALLKKIKEQPFYDVSPSQEGIYYATKMSGENSILYNMPGYIIFNKKPNVKKLNACFNKLIDRHPSFRTCFEIVDNKVCQKIMPITDFKITETQAENKNINKILKNFVKPFNLEKSPLFRAELVYMQDKVLLLFDMHHIISDGLSVYILSKELKDLYNNKNLEPLNFNYVDYTYYIHTQLSSGLLDDSKVFWTSMFGNKIPVLNLPYDKERPESKSFNGSKFHSTIEQDLSFKINMLAKELNVSNYMILLACYYILLNKYSNQQDIIVGSPFVGRNKEDFAGIVGMFVNTLPLRVQIDENISFIQFINYVKETCINAFEHQLYPFNEITKNINLKRDTSRSPLFDVIFSYQNSYENINFIDTNISKYDLSLDVISEKDEFRLNFEYCTDLFNLNTIKRFANQYINILKIILENINIPIKNIDILSLEEKQKLKISNKNGIKNSSNNKNSSSVYYAPRTPLELKIANIFEKILDISPISIKDNFFELGGDSLLAMSLQVELMKISKNITYSDIFVYSNVEELAKHLEHYIYSSSYSFSDTDFSSLTPLLDKNLVLDTNIKKTNIGNILITGVTGFLGAHILDEYFKQYPSGKAYCLIREEIGLTLEEKLLNKLHFYFGDKYDDLINKKIIIVNGDITKENFGLTKNTLLKLSKNIDCVINSAAKTSHYGNYSIFKNINVVGAQNVANFCKEYNKKLYHISTLSISGNAFMSQNFITNKKQIIFKENNLYVNQSLENVYARSKFEAEKYILEEINNNNLNAYILRIGNLMPRFSDGKFQPNKEENAYANRLSTFTKIKIMPDYLLDNYAEFTPVDSCAQAIIKLIENPSNFNRIFHLFNHNHIYVKQLLDIFDNYIDIKIVSNEEFLKQIDILLSSNNSDEILSGILSDFDKNRKLIYDSNIKLNSNFTVKYLKNIGFKWPSIKKDYLITFFKLLYGEGN